MSIIKSQYYELNVPSKEIFDSISKTLPELNDRIMKNVLEKSEKVLIKPNHTFIIDKIELDLGNINCNDIENALEQLIENEFIKVIKDKSLSSEFNEELTFSKQNTIKSERQLENKSPDSRIIEAMIFFFRNGYFPWWISYEEIHEIPISFIHNISCADKSKTLQLLECLEANVSFERMYSLYEIEQIILILSNIISVLYNTQSISGISNSIQKNIKQASVSNTNFQIETITQVFNALEKSSLDIKALSAIHTDIVKEFFRQLYASVNSYANIIDLIREAMNLLLKYFRNFSAFPFERFIKLFLIQIDLSVKDSSLKFGITQMLNTYQKNIESDTQIFESNSCFENENELSNTDYKFPNAIISENINDYIEDTKINFNLNSKTEEYDKNIQRKYSSEDDIYISNAGLVLLFPYITNFFRVLKLIAENKFVSIQTTHKAVHLLDYLVYKEINTHEFNTPLNKIVCGLSVSHPLDPEIALNESEKKECDELLKAVVNNWTALKNTTTEGLRNAFLRRNGVILLKDDNLILRVERKSIDILIDNIPWSFNTIKFPWMNKILYVEW